ncbi:MAG: hypothetical protein SNJ54_13750 [Anaerolineae bacterium]
MYPSNWITVKEYPDGTRWCTVKDKNIPVQVFSGGISREAVAHAEQASDDIFAAHANDNPFCMIADLRKLQGLTGYIRQNTRKRLDSFSKHRRYYFALLMNQTLPNRLMAVFLSGLARISGSHISMQVFYHPEAAQAWLESKLSTTATAS